MAATTDVTKVADKPRSRRAVLAGALGGLGAWAASAAGRLDPAQAAAGDPIRMGQLNKAGGTSTTLQTGSTGAALRVVQLHGSSAVRAESTSGRAVQALAGQDGTGVWGFSPNHRGVLGRTETGWGVIAQAFEANGVALSAFAFAPEAMALETFGPSNLSGDVRILQGRLTLDTFGTPPAPTNGATLFVDSSAGKRRLAVRFPTGDVQVLATEP